MTHEQHTGIGGEPRGGPQIDRRLPDATEVPEYDDVEDSLYQVHHFEDHAEPMPDARGNLYDEEG